jgi:hypothetical protein
MFGSILSTDNDNGNEFNSEPNPCDGIADSLLIGITTQGATTISPTITTTIHSTLNAYEHVCVCISFAASFIAICAMLHFQFNFCEGFEYFCYQFYGAKVCLYIVSYALVCTSKHRNIGTVSDILARRSERNSLFLNLALTSIPVMNIMATLALREREFDSFMAIAILLFSSILIFPIYQCEEENFDVFDNHHLEGIFHRLVVFAGSTLVLIFSFVDVECDSCHWVLYLLLILCIGTAYTFFNIERSVASTLLESASIMCLFAILDISTFSRKDISY